MEKINKLTLPVAILIASIILLAYGFLFQRYIFIHIDGVTVIRCSNISGDCNYFKAK